VGSMMSKIAINATKIGRGTMPMRLVVLVEINFRFLATGTGSRFG
jgi:hypothetical protein